MRTNNTFERIEVVDLNDMAISISSLDKAAPTDIYWGNVQHPQKSERHLGVVNMTTGKLASINSEGYQIIQHGDVAQAIVETLGRLNLNVKGRINNYGNKFCADLAFQKEGLEIQDDAQGIKLGIRVMNSYDKSSSFRLEMYGFRMICQNGMSFGKRFGVIESTIHYGSREKNLAAISKITEGFIARVIESSAIMQSYVNDMIGDSLEYNMAIRIIRAMFKKKHSKQIISRLENCKSRWEMYNAVTNYITHGEHLTPNVQTYLEKLSQKIMDTNSNTLTVETEKLEQAILLAQTTNDV